jgi:hypothetical protein
VSIESFAALWNSNTSQRKRVSLNSFLTYCFSGYRSMNTKLALSAIIAALMLTACAKQEAAAPAEAPAAEAPAAEAPPAEPAAEAPPADAAAPAGDAAAPAGEAAPAEPPKE